MHWLDRLTSGIAPRWTLQRVRARAVAEVVARHYEGAAKGRRTSGWNLSNPDPNAAAGPALQQLRIVARDLTRNNPYAESAVSTIIDHVVGWGIVPSPTYDRWTRWAETTACDADGRHDLYGLQKLVMRTVVESGECLIRRRWRRLGPDGEPEGGLPLPMQLQVLEPDYLDPMMDGIRGTRGGPIIQGIEFNGIGRRVFYHILRSHPGAAAPMQTGFGISDPIPAEEILHVCLTRRPGAVRGVSWFAPVILTMKDFDEYQDAALMKQKIAACLAVISTDMDGSPAPLGEPDATDPSIDRLSPGMILHGPPGKTISVIQPPTVREHGEYSATVLRGIATGLGITYEDLTGDYQGMPFSAARMSRLRHWDHVHDWRWRMLIPQFCDPVWRWAEQAAALVGPVTPRAVRWTAPPPPLIEPDKEARGYNLMIRNGLMSLSEALREQGYNPDEVFAEMASDWDKIEALGLILDSNPAQTTQQGGPRAGVADVGPGGEEEGRPEPEAEPVENGNRANGIHRRWRGMHD